MSDDGSPLAIYLALPADETPMLVHAHLPAGASILELGCGPGRATRVLVALGHEVTAVDDSAEMLAHVTGARTVCADLFSLRLDRTFGAVLAASHLINHPEQERRRALLDVCARHVRPGDGVVLIERYSPGWLATATATRTRRGPVELEFEPHGRSGSVVSASMTYRLSDRRWTQRFEAADVDDDELDHIARTVGLRLDRPLASDGTWLLLRPG